MNEKQRKDFKKLYEKHNVKLITFKYNNDSIIETVLYDCPICDETHKIEKHKHTVTATYNIGETTHEETYFRCTNPYINKEESDFFTGEMLKESAKNRQLALLNLLETLE